MPSNSRSLSQFPSIVSFVTANSTLVMANSSTSGTSYVGGALGVGTTSLTGNTLRLGKTMTGATAVTALNNTGTVQSDATSSAVYFQALAATQAASFTLPVLKYFSASQGTFGASSSVTNQYGYDAVSNLTGATNNYGFYGNIAAATGRYNLYMSGTADNYLAGSLGIGGVPVTAQNIRLVKTLTGAVNAYNFVNQSIIQSDVTTAAYLNYSGLNTAAASFTLSNAIHFYANQETIGAGSAITAQHGFLAQSSITGATNNYAFRGAIAAATGRYNLYMDGTADNYLAGGLGIGTASVTGTTLNLAKTITGATNAYSVYNSGAIQSDVTGSANMYLSYPTTAATAFTLPTLRHFYAALGGIGAGSAITTQIGYLADTSVIGATNNYGFYGSLAAATGRYNLYMAGTADNYLAGSLGVGATTEAYTKLSVGGTYPTNSAATQIVRTAGVIPSGTTSGAWTFLSAATTQAASFTLANWYHFSADPAAFGAGSAVTSQYGFIANSGMNAATNNFGFYGNLAAATGRWNLYMNGTANNYLAGNLLIGNTTQTNALAVNGVITEIANGTYYNVVTQYDIGTAANQVPLNQNLGSMAYQDSTSVAMGNAVASGSISSINTFGFKNRIINGGMVIDQRNAGASVTPTNGAYTLDRWKVGATQASKFTIQQNAGSITPPAGFSKYLGVTSSSAYSILTTDEFTVFQPIEGQNVADLGWGSANAKAVTLSFWVYSSLTGTFGGALNNSALDRTYSFSYSISSANTWTKINITITGDTLGTWLTTNGVGIFVQFGLGVGSNSSKTAGSWQAGYAASVTGATSVVGTNGATWYITGVQLEVGSQATSFDFRDYGRELILCQRYYTQDTNTPVAKYTIFNSGNARSTPWFFPVTMRAAPTVTFNDNAGNTGKIIIANDGGSSQTNISPPSTTVITQNNWRFEAGGMTGTTGNSGFIQLNYFATAEL